MKELLQMMRDIEFLRGSMIEIRLRSNGKVQMIEDVDSVGKFKESFENIEELRRSLRSRLVERN